MTSWPVSDGPASLTDRSHPVETTAAAASTSAMCLITIARFYRAMLSENVAKLTGGRPPLTDCRERSGTPSV
jgi:hypothetical protein